MYKESKKYVHSLIVILMVLLTLFLLVYFFIHKTTLEIEANNLSYEQHNKDVEIFENLIDELYNDAENETLEWDYILDTNNQISINKITIAPINEIIVSETSTEYYLFLENQNNRIYYKEFKNVLSLEGIYTNDFVYIIENNGLIKYSTNNAIYNQNFFTNSFIPTNKLTELDKIISSNSKGIIEFKESNKNMVMSITSMENNLVYISRNIQYNFYSKLNPLVWTYFTLNTITFAVFVIFGLITIKRRYDEDQIYKKFKIYKKDKALVIEVNTNGDIINFNDSIKKIIGQEGNISLSNIFIRNKDYKEILNHGSSFVEEVSTLNGNVKYRFIILKKNKGYLLIGEETNTIEGFEKNYKELALINRETKLPNDLGLINVLDSIDKTRKFTLVSLGIDQYNRLIDSIGSSYLKTFNNNLVNEIKENIDNNNMTLYHYGVNHYIILIENVLNFDSIEAWVKSFINKINASIIISELPLTMLLKASIINNNGKVISMNSDEILESLTITLERVFKSSVYNQLTYQEKFTEFVVKNKLMEQDIKNGIENDEFEMYLQPQYNIITKKVIGFESLLRWNNPLYSKEAPSTYIRVAEESNLIVELGRVIMEKVIKIAKFYSHTNYVFSFNISPRHLMQQGFINDLLELTNKYNVEPTKIAIELTETLLMTSLTVVTEKFRKLREIGFQIHLDDFGTGYSSLSYLKNLPVDVLKIDKKFIDDIESSFVSRQILKTMTSLGKNLKLEIIYEGVETEKQIEIIKKDGGEIIQGFFISRPMKLVDVEEFLKRIGK